MVTRKSPPPKSLRLAPEVAHASLQRTRWGKVRRPEFGEGEGFGGGSLGFGERGGGREGGAVQEVEVAEGVGPGAELPEEGDERGGVGAQGVAVRLLEEAVEVRQLLGAAREPLDVRHEGLQGLHQRRRRRRRRARPNRLRGRRREVGFRRPPLLGGVSEFGLRLRFALRRFVCPWGCLGWAFVFFLAVSVGSRTSIGLGI